MNSLAIIAAIGMAVLVTSTVGFGASLTTTPEFNLIGASENLAVGTARGNVTALVWTEQVATDGLIETDEITFTVGNEDASNAHAFQVCAVIEGPASTYTPAAGSAPACVNVSSAAALAETAGQIISFSTPVDVNDIVDISFTIEELISTPPQS